MSRSQANHACARLARSWRARVLALVFWQIGLGACRGPVDPTRPAADLLVLDVQSGRLLLVDSRTPAVTGEVGPRAYPIHGPTIRRDGKVLFFSGKYPDESWKLVALDLTSRQVAWTLDQARSDGTFPTHNGVQLAAASDGLAVSGDGASLYIAPAIQGETRGIATVDIGRREVRGFWGPFRTYQMVVVSGSSAPGVDTIVAIGTRGPDIRRARDSVYVLRTGASFEVLAVVAPPPGSWQIWSLADGPGSLVYVAGDQAIGVYDMAARAYTAVRWRQGFGRVVSSPDGEMVALPDPGDPPVAPTGLLPVFGAGLQPLALFDLRSLATAGVPPATSHVAFSPTSAELFVTAGSTTPRQDFGVEAGRLFILNWRTGAVRAVLDLQDWGHASVFLLP